MFQTIVVRPQNPILTVTMRVADCRFPNHTHDLPLDWMLLLRPRSERR
jgi:hypothetical protein